MNVESCIQLHNAIVVHALPNHPRDHQHRVQRNWFAAHNLDPSSPGLNFTIDDNLKRFLEGIDVVVPEEHQHSAFTPFLVGIAGPNELRPQQWEDCDDYDDEFILLYKSSSLKHETGGLVLSLATQQVCCVSDIYESPRECLWGDLDKVLEIYMRCINAGKFVLDTEQSGSWRVEEFTAGELDLALEMWDNLIASIVARLPPLTTEASRQPENDGPALIPNRILDMYPSIPPFARAFLSRAKKPTFRYIAPQLQVPDEDFIHRGQDVIYEHGMCNPFIPDHRTPLAAILVNWWEQLENSFWTVDEHGVAGGEQLWRKADTEEDAEDFRTEWVCF